MLHPKNPAMFSISQGIGPPQEVFFYRWPDARPCLVGSSGGFGKSQSCKAFLSLTFLLGAQRNWRFISQRVGEIGALSKTGFYWVTLQSTHLAFLLTELNIQPKYWKGNAQAAWKDTGGRRSGGAKPRVTKIEGERSRKRHERETVSSTSVRALSHRHIHLLKISSVWVKCKLCSLISSQSYANALQETLPALLSMKGPSHNVAVEQLIQESGELRAHNPQWESWEYFTPPAQGTWNNITLASTQWTI